MGTVTLLNPLGKSSTYTMPYGKTLLNLASSLNLPLYNECRMERCGNCAVKVAVVGKHTTCQSQPGEIEKSILYRAGKLSREQYKSETPPVRQSLWRLACQYVIGNEEIVVAL